MTKIIINILIILILFILASVAHEQDIAKTCIKQGNSGYAGWTVKIECKEMLSKPPIEPIEQGGKKE